MKFYNISVVVSTILLWSSSLSAQPQEIKAKKFIEVIGSYSPTSVVFLGKTPEAKTVTTYIGYGKKINNLDNGAELYVTRGIIPFSEYVYPKRDNGNAIDIVNGYGISPLGYHIIFPNKFLKFYGGVSSGIMLMNKTFPTDKGRRINYTFDFTFGFNKSIQKNTFLSLGYRFHHISNAQTGNENPGIDSNFLFLSIKHFTNVD